MIKSRKSIRVPKSCVVQTPPSLAEAMVCALGDSGTDSWLEPCVGEGALLTALARAGVQKHRVIGLDVDAKPQQNDRFGRILRGQEFLAWSRSTESRFSKIVANPPYVAIERLSAAIRIAAIEAALSDRIKINANGNAWYAFLCAAIRLLKSDGSLCFLLPASWDFANYAAPLRNTISNYFRGVEIYRTENPIFRANQVQEGAIVLVARGRSAAPMRDPRPVYRHHVRSIDELITALSASRGIKSTSKNVVPNPTVRRPRKLQALQDIMKIQLGVVTGDSSYFLLTETRRRELGLPVAALTPVLSRARHLTSANMDVVQWNILKNADEKIWLFNPTSERIVENKFVRSYLMFGHGGGCKVDNHKVAIRNPWFKLPEFSGCDGFMSGMSSHMPWISFRGMSNLVATNTLYSVKFSEACLQPCQQLGVAMSLLTSYVRRQMRERGRLYAAGLLKFEPGDLLALEVPKIGSVVAGWKVYRRALGALSNGDYTLCEKIADSCFLDG